MHHLSAVARALGFQLGERLEYEPIHLAILDHAS
jgi:hypothetical protein